MGCPKGIDKPIHLPGVQEKYGVTDALADAKNAATTHVKYVGEAAKQLADSKLTDMDLDVRQNTNDDDIARAKAVRNSASKFCEGRSDSGEVPQNTAKADPCIFAGKLDDAPDSKHPRLESSKAIERPGKKKSRPRQRSPTRAAQRRAGRSAARLHPISPSLPRETREERAMRAAAGSASPTATPPPPPRKWQARRRTRPRWTSRVTGKMSCRIGTMALTTSATSSSTARQMTRPRRRGGKGALGSHPRPGLRSVSQLRHRGHLFPGQDIKGTEVAPDQRHSSGSRLPAPPLHCARLTPSAAKWLHWRCWSTSLDFL